MRILKNLDFIPDFAFNNNNNFHHSASFGGKRWILFICNNLSALYKNTSDIKTLLDASSNTFPVFLVTFESFNFSEYEFLFKINQSYLKELFFNVNEDCSDLTCLIIDKNQKIINRYDFDFDRFSVFLNQIFDYTSSFVQVEEPLFMPVLRVPLVFEKQFCEELIRYHLNSQEKVQGRVGLSNPEYNPNLKRVMHVNSDIELAAKIDNKLIFSLIPAIERVFDEKITHRMAYKVSSYNSDDKGFFSPHRDNTDLGTSFRRFGLTISLNDNWEGGGICFPEYSDKSFKLPAGDALVFPASLMHQVNPVITGERFILLSFLYDQDGAKLRRSMMENPEVLNNKYKDSIDNELIKAYSLFSFESRFNPQYNLD